MIVVRDVGSVEGRPYPPAEVLEAVPTRQFVPAPALVDWARSAFVGDQAAASNPDHQHLTMAEIGAVWTNEPAKVRGRRVVGMAEVPQPRGRGWIKVRQEAQLVEWFGRLPHFVLTFHAPYAAQAEPAAFCALVEHELYHCGQARDECGQPRFRRDGRPVFAIRGHDVEEFVGVVRRYGAAAAAGRTADLVRAAQREPEVARADVAGLCGTCRAAA